MKRVRIVLAGQKDRTLQRLRYGDYLWGCNGFDGDLETRAAIRGSGTTLKPGLNINAEDNFALAA